MLMPRSIKVIHKTYIHNVKNLYLLLFIFNTVYQLHEKNDKILHTVHGDRNILHAINRWKAKWIGHILRRNCLLKQVVEGYSDGKTRKKTSAATG